MNLKHFSNEEWTEKAVRLTSRLVQGEGSPNAIRPRKKFQDFANCLTASCLSICKPKEVGVICWPIA